MIDARARQSFYAFFSRLFVRELDDSAIAALAGPLGRELLPDFFASAEATLLEKPSERQALFDADFVHLTVVNLVPYESFYRRDDAMVVGGADNPVSKFLQSYGFDADLTAARSLAPDHIGIELEAMATFCAHEADALARPDPAYAAKIRGVERSFLREHLCTFAPIYLFAVERCAHTTLYREAAQTTMQFLASDFEALCNEATP